MNLAKMAVHRPVTITMLLIMLLLFGGVSLFGLPMDLMTKIDLPMAIVQTSYSGAGPREVENMVTDPLESALGTVSRVSELQSISSTGYSLIIVSFEDGTDVDQGALDLRERIDMIKPMLPDNADAPRVMKIDMNQLSNTQIAITSDKMDLIELKKKVEDELVPRYERLDGIASVGLAGGRSQEVQVELIPEKMREYGITEAQVSQVLRSENANSAAGTIKQGEYRLQLRTMGEFTSVDDIKKLLITTSSGQPIYFSEIADVSTVFKDLTSYAYINDKPAILLTLQKSSSANTVNVSDRMIAENAKITEQYKDITVTVVTDQATSVRVSISNVVESLIIGFSAAILILFFFLRNLLSTFIVGIAIPVSVIGTFAMMYFGHITLNMISLLGLTLGVGMLVDNSIVVLECIFRRFEEGEDRTAAAINGAKEVSMAVTASTLTHIAVFLPIVFMSGLIANIFRDLSLTISFSMVMSLLISLTFVPMLCSLVLRRPDPTKRKNRLKRILDGIGRLTGKLDTAYRRLLVGALRIRKTVLVLIFLLFLGTGIMATSIGAEFMTNMDMSAINVSISMPKGTLLEKTFEKTQEIQNAIEDIPEIVDTVLIVGSSGALSLSGSPSDSASMMINLKPKLERKRSADAISAEIRERVKDIPGVDVTVASRSMNAMMSDGLLFQITGSDLDTISEIARELSESIRKIPGVVTSTTSLEDTSPEASIRIDREKAASYGITTATVSSIVNTAVNGSVPTQLKVGGKELDIRIRQSKSELEYLKDIQHIMIPTPGGGVIPLSDIATVVVEQSPVAIDRINQERYVTVSTTFEGRTLSDVSADVEAVIKAYEMPSGYNYHFGGQQEQMMDSFGALGLAFILAVLLIYMITASQFESLIHPFLIMLTVPLSMTFGLLGLIFSGQTLNITSIIGLIMLAGIIVSNGIIMISYTNQLRREGGLSIRDALLKAGPVRLRPILMSTLTSVLGMVPMIINSGPGAEMMRPMAVVVATGLLFGTLITLIFIPVSYSLVDEYRERRRQKRKARRESILLKKEAEALQGPAN